MLTKALRSMLTISKVNIWILLSFSSTGSSLLTAFAAFLLSIIICRTKTAGLKGLEYHGIPVPL